MVRPFARLTVAALLAVLLASPAIADDAADLLQRARDQARAETVIGQYRVEIVRPDWQRTLEMKTYEDDVHERYALILEAPPRVAGITFLKADERLWMYMPKLRKRVAISPAMMLEPWMGSDLNNQDLLEADSIIEDYTHEIVEREAGEETEVVTIESRPRPDAPVVWGLLRHRIRADAVPLSVDYFDREGELVRSLRFDEVEAFGDRRLPTHWIIEPAGETGQRTEVFIEDVQFDVDLPAEAFERLPADAGGSPEEPR
jgi:outer membrane lipoprotein-sorting protein